MWTYNTTPSTELYHYGVKGMKWGVRRYQNKDGSLTSEGKKKQLLYRNIKRNEPYTKDINDVVNSLSDNDKRLLGAPLNQEWIQQEYSNKTLKNKAVSFVQKQGNIPISFVEIWTNEGRTGQISVATRPGEKYRGKGYADKNVKDAIKWVDKYGKYSIDELEWFVYKNNLKSINLADKNGFIKDYNFKDENYERYIRYVKK